MVWIVKTKFPASMLEAYSTLEEAMIRAEDLNSMEQTTNYYVSRALRVRK